VNSSGQAKNYAQCAGFGEIGKEHRKRHLVEAEAALDAEGPVQLNGSSITDMITVRIAMNRTPRAIPPGKNEAARLSIACNPPRR